MSADLPPIDFTRPAPTDAYSGAGERAEHPFAVMYQGEYETLWDGTAVAVRAHARALSQAGIPVHLKSFSSTVIDENGTARPAYEMGLPVSVQQEVGALELTRASAYYPVIKHAVIRDGEHLKQMVLPRGAVGRDFEESARLRAHIYASTIVYSVWERDRIDPAIAQTLARVAQCWVPSRQNAALLASAGVPEEKIRIVPHPFDPGDAILTLRRRSVARHDGWRKFYNIGRWEPRKGQVELVEAFLMAFTPKDKVVLTIKYTGGRWPDYETPERLIERVVTTREFTERGWNVATIKDRVRLIEGRFPRAAILKIHYHNNIYVSSSHGEAWGLPAFEGALAGNQLVYVPSGGVEDFVPSEGHVAVDIGQNEEVPGSYKWEHGAKWTGYSRASLASALQRSAIPASHHSANGMSDYTMQAVGALMRKNILEVAQKHPGALAYYERA